MNINKARKRCFQIPIRKLKICENSWIYTANHTVSTPIKIPSDDPWKKRLCKIVPKTSELEHFNNTQFTVQSSNCSETITDHVKITWSRDHLLENCPAICFSGKLRICHTLLMPPSSRSICHFWLGWVKFYLSLQSDHDHVTLGVMLCCALSSKWVIAPSTTVIIFWG